MSAMPDQWTADEIHVLVKPFGPAAFDTAIESALGRPIDYGFADWRPHDQRYFVADNRRARSALRLPKPKPWREGTLLLLREIAARHNVALPGESARKVTA